MQNFGICVDIEDCLSFNIYFIICFRFSKIEERSSIVNDNDADRSEEDERSQAESSDQVIVYTSLINEEVWTVTIRFKDALLIQSVSRI